jgi:microcystin-dependent protein
MRLFLARLIRSFRSLLVAGRSPGDNINNGVNVNINVSFNQETPRKFEKKDIVGTIKIFAGDVYPDGWLPCDGRCLKIREYADLYTIIGTTYGGNGRTTFALPDLRGRVPVGAGEGFNLSVRQIGQIFGDERVTVKIDNMPIKLTDASVSRDKSSSNDEDLDEVNRLVNSSMLGRRMKNLKDGLPLENMQPSICLNYIICCIGIYPDYIEDLSS